MTTICITIPGTAEMHAIGYAISLALNPDKGETNNFGSEFVPDSDGNMVRPGVYTTYDFPCSSTFAATARALASDAKLMYDTVTADYAARWPERTPLTLAECVAFCKNVQVTVKSGSDATLEPDLQGLS